MLKSLQKIYLLFTLFISAGIAQTYDSEREGLNLKFNHFSVEQGLSQSTVHSIIQDDKGFIWIGTQNGLNMFDGFEFIVYTNDRNDSTSLSDDHIRTIIQDNNGLIWVGTNKGLNVLTLIEDKQTGKLKKGFYHFKHNSKNQNSLSNNEVRSIYQDKSGTFWIGTAKGLNKAIVSPDKIKSGNIASAIKFTNYFYDPADQNSLGHNFISSVAEDSSGNLWVGTMGGGLNLFNRKTGKITRFKSISNDANSLSSNFIIRLYIDGSGALWIGTYGGGLCKYDYNSGGFINYKHNPNNKSSISDNRIFNINEDAEGGFWIGTFGNGIDKFNPLTERFINFRNNEYDPNSLSNDFARALYIDRSNNLWVGTNRGLNKADLKSPKFLLFKNDPWSSSTLSDNFILSLFEGNSGFLWIGTNKGLNKYDQSTDEYINYNIPHNNPRSGEGFVYAINQDKSGMLWLGTFGGGIYEFNPVKGKIVKQYLYNPNNTKGINDNRVTTIFQDSNEDLLIGTVAGVCRFNINTGEFRHYLLSSEDSSMLAGKWINRIYKDSKKNYWIGSSEGLFRIDSSTGICNRLSFIPGDETSLSNNSVTSFYQDNSNLWIGTDEGLNLFDNETGHFIQYYKHDGLPGNSIAGILGDDEGNLWLATSNGISMFDQRNKSFRNYDVDDGLQGMEFNAGAYFKNRKGEIFFGGLYGFNKFNPAFFKDNQLPPEITITAFKKFDKVEKTYLEFSDQEPIELSYGDRFFSFEFAALDYTNPEKNQYAYMLEGFDNNWNYIGNRRFASYTNIDPGQYIFRVKGSNNDGVWNEQGASIRIIIAPPFYSTWWAYTFYSLAFITVLFFLRQYEMNKRKRKEEAVLKEEREKAKLREAHLRAEKAELQAKAIESEKEIEKQNIRYRIASDLHDEIGSNLSSISLISSILTNNFLDNYNDIKKDGEVLNKLTDINTAAKSSAESIRDIVWFINPLSDQIGSLISRMKETANMMLVNIHCEINTDIIFPDEKINPEIKRNIYLIYKEALNNIIKHSKAGKVDIVIRNIDHNFILSISDNGIGFPQGDGIPGKKNINAGNGLRNLRTRTEQIKGELLINSQLGKGTTITLKVSLEVNGKFKD